MIATPAAALSRTSLRPVAVAMLLAIAAGPSLAALPTGASSARRPAIPHRATTIDLARRIDVNRVNMFTTNIGSFAFDLTSGSPGLIHPKGTNQTAVFASGLWIGARVAGEVRATVAEYSMEYGPGGMVGGTFDDPDRPEHVVYKVARWTGDPADSEHVDRTPAELAADPLLDPILHHSWSEYRAAKPFGAPTRIYRLPVTSTPQPDDSVDVEGPNMFGDQMLWEVHNDADPARHTNDAGNSTPLGVEIQQSTFAYDRADAFGDIVFFRFRIFNRGANTLDDLYVSLWSDPDVGGASDDLVGCDVSLGMGYAYNANNNDIIYGSAPPAVGYVLLRGPETPFGTPGMTAFSKYINGTDPFSTSQTYNYMQGLLPDGSVVIDPTNGQPTPFFHSGDPVTFQGWVDSQPADRRMNLTTGPARMLPGDVQDVWAALVVGHGSDRLASITAARCLATKAKDLFYLGFRSLPAEAISCPSEDPPEVANCPKPATFWGLECAAGGAGQLSAQELQQAAAFVNSQSTLFDWAAPLPNFCGTVSPPHPPDARQRAKSEFATFLANYSGSQLDLTLDGGQRLFLDPATPISCPPLAATSIGELAATADSTPQLLDAVYLNHNLAHRRALEGVNFGLSRFNGGADVGFNFFGSPLDPLAMPDSFTTVQLRFDQNATQKAYRFVRMQTTAGSAPPAYPDRGYLNRGFVDVPFQAWDATNDIQLDVAFVEREVTDDAGVRLGAGQVASSDSAWGPTTEADGGREYLLVYARPYSDTPKPELAVDGSILNGTAPVLYVVAARLRLPSDVIDDGDVFEFQWGLAGSPGADRLLLELEGQPLSDPAVAAAYTALADCLAGINDGIGIGPTCDEPTPTLVSLVSTEAGPDRITLRWYCADAGLSASVERRAAAEGWTVIGRVAPDGSGMLVFEDHDVTAGGTYDYRLAVGSGEHVEYLGETRVEVPSGTTLAFLGIRSSPGDGRVLLAYSLRTREPARLELMDVAGRRLFARDLTGMAPGVHTLALEDHVRLPAGIYLVRIHQGAQRAAGKAAIVR